MGVAGERRAFSPATTEEWMCEARIVPSAAMPVATPTWRSVRLMPDAIPARAGSTTPTAVEMSGVLTRPAPTPLTIMLGRKCVQPKWRRGRA